jgi:hypothetical protein
LGKAGEPRIRAVQEEHLDRLKVRNYIRMHSGMIPELTAR